MIIITWGGSLNREGSDYIRELKEADNAIKFLEKLKEKVNKQEYSILSNTIDIIIKHYSKEK